MKIKKIYAGNTVYVDNVKMQLSAKAAAFIGWGGGGTQPCEDIKSVVKDAYRMDHAGEKINPFSDFVRDSYLVDFAENKVEMATGKVDTITTDPEGKEIPWALEYTTFSYRHVMLACAVEITQPYKEYNFETGEEAMEMYKGFVEPFI
jgi:hypothetical protein